MKITDLIVEITGKNTALIREAAQLFTQYTDRQTVTVQQADILRRFANDYRKLVKKHGGTS